MENKKSIQNKSKLIYELGADVTFEFSNGDSFRINKTVAALHSSFFAEIFFGPTATTKFQVKNFDSETFKIFLDCLFGLKEYSILDSLLIYPIAHEYQVMESIENCVAVLKPKVMDENVPIILNLALFYNNSEILNNVMDFIKTEIGVVGFMENEIFRDLSEPATMCRLIEDAELNSFVWKIIVKWAENYFKKNSKETDLRSFFKEIGILSKLDFNDFESLYVVFNFYNETKLFESCKFLDYLNSRMISCEPKLPEISEWIKSDETFTETIEFVNPSGFSGYEHLKGLFFEISTNKIFFENFKHNNNPILEVRFNYRFRNFSILLHSSCDPDQHEIGCPIKQHENRHRRSKCCCLKFSDVAGFVLSFDFNKTLKISSDGLVFNTGVYEFPNQFQEIGSIYITYRFKNIHNFRFLKTTLSEKFKKSDELYFTKNVRICPVQVQKFVPKFNFSFK